MPQTGEWLHKLETRLQKVVQSKHGIQLHADRDFHTVAKQLNGLTHKASTEITNVLQRITKQNTGDEHSVRGII
ncbi:hypothetical protein PROFUN_15673 [Planoprotostelium fungivorum]|uniref:Uncharacterized protein n=1 Tax=Planoprotostelium fungivorum TaxID=1890364 RepID=A0A2P6MS58_9EUKA|nr:hypothetical protein PROFUN_15673 [Planoprotostelium fungivorum]